MFVGALMLMHRSVISHLKRYVGLYAVSENRFPPSAFQRLFFSSRAAEALRTFSRAICLKKITENSSDFYRVFQRKEDSGL